jgi:hypothetical protein
MGGMSSAFRFPRRPPQVPTPVLPEPERSGRGKRTASTRTPTPVGGGRRLPRGFRQPALEMTLPSDLGRRPTSADVELRKGFDGRTLPQMVEAAFARLKSPLAGGQRAALGPLLAQNAKAFTLEVNNAFVPGSAVHLRFSAADGAQVAVVGTASATHPTLLEVVREGREPTYLLRDSRGGFQPLARMGHPIAFRAELHWEPDGVKVTYPAWQPPALSASDLSAFEG